MKRIKFPLLLKNKYPVRNMEELREHFDIGKLYEYLCDGRLLIWLEDRQYEEAEKIKEYTGLEENLAETLCKIFQVEYEEKYSERIKEFQKARTKFILVGKEATDSEQKRVEGAGEQTFFEPKKVAEKPEQKSETEKKNTIQYMFCIGCGMKLKRNVKFCNYCGRKNLYGEA